MHTLSDAIRIPTVVNTHAETQPGIYKAPYRGWIWLATFGFGTTFWVALGYSVYAMMGP
jgi:hypothetical protein